MKTIDNLPLFKEFSILFKNFEIDSWNMNDFIQYFVIIGVEHHSLNHFRIVRFIIRLIIEDILKIDDVPEREKNTTYSESNGAELFRIKFCFDENIPEISNKDFEKVITSELISLVKLKESFCVHPHSYTKNIIQNETQTLANYLLKFIKFKQKNL